MEDVQINNAAAICCSQPFPIALLPPMQFIGSSDLLVKDGTIYTADVQPLTVALIGMGDTRLLYVRDVALPELLEELIAFFKEARA